MLNFFAATPSALSPVTPLQRRQTFQLRGRRGERIECRTGQLWITQDGDPRDVILKAGECFTLDRAGATLVSALEEASFAYRRGASAIRGRQATTPLAAAPLPACAS